MHQECKNGQKHTLKSPVLQLVRENNISRWKLWFFIDFICKSITQWEKIKGKTDVKEEVRERWLTDEWCVMELSLWDTEHEEQLPLFANFSSTKTCSFIIYRLWEKRGKPIPRETHPLFPVFNSLLVWSDAYRKIIASKATQWLGNFTRRIRAAGCIWGGKGSPRVSEKKRCSIIKNTSLHTTLQEMSHHVRVTVLIKCIFL